MVGRASGESDGDTIVDLKIELVRSCVPSFHIQLRTDNNYSYMIFCMTV